MNERKFEPREIGRYSRQIVLRRWGLEGQRRIKNANVVIVGLGGLGTVVAAELAKAGVGKIVLVDPDVVEEVNLSAQLLHWDSDIGKPKVISVKEKLEAMNPFIEVEAIQDKLTDDNVKDLLGQANVIVDATDNLNARSLINKTCVELKTPFVHAGIRGFRGQLLTVVPGEGPCLACLFGKMEGGPRSCPVVGAAVSTLASIQALEVLKLITGIGKPLIGRLLIFDGLNGEFDVVDVSRREDCPVCGGI